MFKRSYIKKFKIRLFVKTGKSKSNKPKRKQNPKLVDIEEASG